MIFRIHNKPLTVIIIIQKIFLKLIHLVLKLHALKLEMFDEKPEHYPAFSDDFRSLIQNNNKPDDVAKFMYLDLHYMMNRV